MAATLHDVARLADVSIKTVSNVINDYPHIRPATRERVEAAIAQLGYQPNLSARSLRSGRTGVIGLALPELSLSYFAELADAVIAAASRRGQTVLLGERIFGGPTDHVTMQNVEGGRAGTEYLLKSGRKRIVVVGAHEGEVIGSAGLRLRGYREALDAAGIVFDPTLVGYTDLWHRANGATSMRQLLASGITFDAVFALNDTLALGAMRVLQEAGIRVPTDVAVLGWDNLDESQYSLPSLSTIDPGKEEIAETAVSALLDRIDGKGSEPAEPREIFASFAIVERESTAVSS